jgi:hypothetical protein
MTPILRGRRQAAIEGDFVVFLIGARLTPWHPLRAFRDLGGLRFGMTAMLKQLSADPDSGLLGFHQHGLTFVQYWRSFEALEEYSNRPDDLHRTAWLTYFRRAAQHQGAGIWHETYLVHAGEYEAIYANMPEFGLGAASRTEPLSGGVTARQRLRTPASAAAAGPAASPSPP